MTERQDDQRAAELIAAQNEWRANRAPIPDASIRAAAHLAAKRPPNPWVLLVLTVVVFALVVWLVRP